MVLHGIDAEAGQCKDDEDDDYDNRDGDVFFDHFVRFFSSGRSVYIYRSKRECRYADEGQQDLQKRKSSVRGEEEEDKRKKGGMENSSRDHVHGRVVLRDVAGPAMLISL